MVKRCKQKVKATTNLGQGSFDTMGLFKGSFTFMVGMGCGVYVAQNYNVPNIKKLFNTYVFMAKHIEETYRKPKKDDD
ncbi:hypothetical protein OsI_06750 [Oryza sativa Indica Group]|uniref:Transmembrane protein n=1 Tax=Oryza sativa subsp. indica TaxID=39946 RepID=A2X3G1_ORYSI|nr:hypothetical protein OsI_06750 [Oryza sativa Indica Group]